jgi:N-acetyl-1-D-myo-inositol-2-amino-2-deoxy-alpha-D-glucopyranoside deacetylase
VTGGLLAVHAHPDDETLATGGLLAAWAADGRPVTLVTCTRGEQGEVIPPELGHLEGDGPALAAHREGELAAASARLGVGDALFLDTVTLPGRGAVVYRDSGMAWAGAGRAARRADLPPDAFVAAPVDDAATRLARVLRDRRPEVVVTYEPGGGYGHPDHVHAHAVTMRAVHLAASGQVPGLEDLPVHAVPVVLWASVADDELRGAYAALAALPAAEQARAERPALTLPEPGGPLPSVAVPAAEVDLVVDVRAVLFRVIAAMGEHRTQVQCAALGTPVPLDRDAALVGCYALSNHVLAPLLDRESYRYAPGSGATDVAWPAVVTPVR